MAIVDTDFWTVRRKLGGACGYPHKGAVCLRMRPTPCDRASKRQMEARAAYARALISWRDLDTLTKVDWWDIADGLPWRDYLAQAKGPRNVGPGLYNFRLYGIQWYLAFNARRQAFGLPVLEAGGFGTWGQALTSLSFSFLTSSSIRVTYSPSMNADNLLVVFAFDRRTSGSHYEVPAFDYPIDSTPRHVVLVGASGQGASSPQDFDLPFVVAAGQLLTIVAGGMEYEGEYTDQWSAASSTYAP